MMLTIVAFFYEITLVKNVYIYHLVGYFSKKCNIVAERNTLSIACARVRTAESVSDQRAEFSDKHSERLA